MNDDAWYTATLIFWSAVAGGGGVSITALITAWVIRAVLRDVKANPTKPSGG